MTDDKDREIADLQARLAAIESQARPSASSPPPPTPPAKGSKEQGCAIAVFAVVAILGLLSYCGSQGSGTSTLTAVSEESSWTPPAGFTLATYAGGNNSRMGTKWVDPTNNECRGAGKTCFAMEVVTEKPCYRSLYASITLLSASDENIGWTNDTAQGVEAGETVRLVFGTYERDVEAARIAELNCY